MPKETLALTRRDVLRRAAMAGLAVPFAGSLAACATSGAGPKNEPVEKGKVDANNPLGMPEDKELEIWIFNGGFKDLYAKDLHEPIFMKKHPKVKIDHHKTVEIQKALQPRYAKGDPPEFVNNAGAGIMDFGSLASGGQIQDLAPLLEAPSWDIPGKTVKETIDPKALEFGTYGDKFCVIFYARTPFGIWYSQKAFKENGWEIPKTWQDFLTLCEDIKKSGKMAPYTFAGKYADYQIDPILTMAAKIGGPEVLIAIDNLEPSAWANEAVLQAAEAWQEVGAKYLLQGTFGLDHLQTQLKQNEYKVAMLPCGSWLENEQKDHAPEGFDYGMFPVPPLGANEKMPPETIRMQIGEGYFVSAKSENPLAGMEYLRAMLSKEGSSGYTDMVSSLTIVTGSEEGVDMKPGLKASTDVLNAAGENVVYYRYPEWYKPMKEESKAAASQLMSGKATPKKFAEIMDKKAKETKDDPDIKKFTRS